MLLPAGPFRLPSTFAIAFAVAVAVATPALRAAPPDAAAPRSPAVQTDSAPAPRAPASSGASALPGAPRADTSAGPLAAPPAAPATGKRSLLAEKLERKLRMEYLKATLGIQGPTIKADSLRAILDDTNLVLLDIRQPEEQAISMLPGAITTREFADRFRKGIPKEKRIVVYCTIGVRSGKYAMELAGQRIRAENLEGGVLAWSHIGGPFVVRNPDGLITPTRRVHVFDKGWNFLHPDYEAVW